MASFKRVLTDEKREFNLASDNNNSGTPDELRARLSNVGSRVRKSVMEGYATTPSTFSKAQSTGTIFQSSKDTLRYVNQTVQPSETSDKKRTRENGYHSDGYDDDDGGNVDVKDAPSADPMATVESRPMKALRKPRKTALTTRSLPNGQLSFGIRSIDEPMAGVEEEDWSLDAPSSSFPTISVVDPTAPSVEHMGS